MAVPSVRIPAIAKVVAGRRFVSIPGQLRTVRLGRRSAETPAKCLELRRYLDHKALSVPPPLFNWSASATDVCARIYANDVLGDCDFASAYHQIGVWSAADTTEGPNPGVQVTDAEVIRAYHEYTGPGDTGAVMVETLDRWQRVGLPVNSVRHKIDGYVRVDPANWVEVLVATYLFGGVRIGLNYLDSWQSQSVPGGVWDAIPGTGLGGHSVPGLGYGGDRLTVCTWGMLLSMTKAALADPRIVDECYAVLAPDWYGSDRLAVVGLNADQLRGDLAALGAGQIPDVPPLPTPTPPDPAPPNPGPFPAPPTPTPPSALDLRLTGYLGNSPGLPITLTGIATPAVGDVSREFVMDLRTLRLYTAQIPVVKEQLGAALVAKGFALDPRARPYALSVRLTEQSVGMNWQQWLAVILAVLEAILQQFPPHT
jgi:hypothetical protein